MSDFWNCLLGAKTKPTLKKQYEYRYLVVQNYANPETGVFYLTDNCMGNFKTREEAIKWTRACPIKDSHLSFEVYKYKVIAEPVYTICKGAEFDEETGKITRR